MAKEKMMNEARFSKMMGEFDSLGELIRTRQDEKQSVMDEFDKERARFRFGKVSKKTMESSARKANAEMAKLNKDIRAIIAKSGRASASIRELVSNQSPKVFRAKVSGITLAAPKKIKRKAKKKTVSPEKKVVSHKKKVVSRKKK